MANFQVSSSAPVSFAPRSRLSTLVTHQSPIRAINNQGGRGGESGDKPKVAWKTIPCWHYVKKKGACPHEGYCCFVHDMQFAAVLERDKEYEKKVTGIEKPSHCWAYIQGRCRNSNCSYLHPKNTKPYIPYTPCINFSRCDQTPYCQFQHPEWVYARGLLREQDKIAQSAYFETLATISGIPIQYSGTTYFPRSALGDSYITSNKGRSNGRLLAADSVLWRNSIQNQRTICI